LRISSASKASVSCRSPAILTISLTSPLQNLQRAQGSQTLHCSFSTSFWQGSVWSKCMHPAARRGPFVADLSTPELQRTFKILAALQIIRVYLPLLVLRKDFW